MQLEKRCLEQELAEVRATSEGKIEGYAAVYGKRSSDLGGFVEEIAPGAFGPVLENKPDVVATIDHEGGLSTIGRTLSGTLELKSDDKGLHYSVMPPDTSAGRDVKVLIGRGDIRGSSFAFRVAPDGEEWRDESGTMVRKITRIAGLYDVSPVTRPAYPDTSVALRSLEAAKEAAKPKEPSAIVEAMRKAVAEAKAISAEDAGKSAGKP